jgi:hypothetical protein
LDVGDEGFEVVGWKIDGGHAAGGHFGGGRFEESGDLIGVEFGVEADECGCGSGAYSAISVAGVTGGVFENGFALGGERIGERDVFGGEGAGGELRLEGFAHVVVFIGFLFGELLRDARVVFVEILAAKAEGDEY